MLNDLAKKLRGVKGIWVLAAVFAVGIMLVTFEYGESSKKDEDENFDCQKYVNDIQTELCRMISQINGAGNADVMVTLESSVEQYYQRDTKNRHTDNGTTVSAETEESLVFQDKMPILVKEIFPEIKGVAVVCGGAKNANVREKIINLVCCALNLPSNRIYVTY